MPIDRQRDKPSVSLVPEHVTILPARLAIFVGLTLLSAACAAPVSPLPAVESLMPASASSAAAAATAGATSSAAETCAARTLDSMNEGQRVGQLFLIGLSGDQLGPDELAAIETDHFGSVWFTETSEAGVSGIRSVSDAVQAIAAAAAAVSGTTEVGFFVAANQEGGLVQALNGRGFSTIPRALAQGLISPSSLESDAARWGGQLQAAGINLNFAPVSDVVPPGTDAQNQPIGVLQREFGHDPATVGSHAAAFVRGMTKAGILTVAKHFPGLGRVVGNTDFAAGVVDTVTTSNDQNLGAFRDVIGANVPFVMVALATYTKIDPSHLAAFSSVVIDNLLRGQLGFRGLVMSDDLGATAAVADIPPATRAVEFISAGGNMIISKTLQPALAMAVAITARTSTDPGFRTLVNDAALRVLQLKQAAHLLSCATP
jgi:beta-N-acetylhexosaminidase